MDLWFAKEAYRSQPTAQNFYTVIGLQKDLNRVRAEFPAAASAMDAAASEAQSLYYALMTAEEALLNAPLTAV